jgi:hypothetical protein
MLKRIQKNLAYIVARNASNTITLENSFLKNLNIHLPYDPANTSVNPYPRKMKTDTHTKI